MTFLGIILRVLRLEVSVYNVYSFKSLVLGVGGGWGVGEGKSVVEVTVISKEETS